MVTALIRLCGFVSSLITNNVVWWCLCGYVYLFVNCIPCFELSKCKVILCKLLSIKTGTASLVKFQSARLLLLLLLLLLKPMVISHEGVAGASLHMGLIPALCIVMQDKDLGMGA